MQPGEANRFSMLSKAVAAQRTRLHSLAKTLRPKDRATDQRNRAGYLMVLPYLLHLAVFLGYIKLLLTDPLIWRALFNTLYFLLIHIPLQLVLALGLAQLLNQKIRGRAFFRASYFMPVVVSGVVVTILWQQMYASETGLINLLLQRFGLPKIGWLTDRRYAMPAIAIMATWKNVGLYVVLFLVGLQGIPADLYEAAELDGASAWQKFRLITMPMLNPIIMLVLLLSTIGGFSLFIEPYVMTGD